MKIIDGSGWSAKVRLHKEEQSRLLFMKMIGVHVQLLEVCVTENVTPMRTEAVYVQNDVSNTDGFDVCKNKHQPLRKLFAATFSQIRRPIKVKLYLDCLWSL